MSFRCELFQGKMRVFFKVKVSSSTFPQRRKKSHRASLEDFSPARTKAVLNLYRYLLTNKLSIFLFERFKRSLMD